MNSPSPTPPPSSDASTRLYLTVRGLENVTSFKNSKEIVRIKGRPKLVTAPRKQKWMERCIRSFESQLSSALATTEGETQTGCSQPCLTALFTPSRTFDDCVQVIPELNVRVVTVKKGEEGADIIIELI